MISLARKRSNDLRIEYRVADATADRALHELGRLAADGGR
jgi:hypothetical protein